MAVEKTMDKIVSLAKVRGFVYLMAVLLLPKESPVLVTPSFAKAPMSPA